MNTTKQHIKLFITAIHAVVLLLLVGFYVYMAKPFSSGDEMDHLQYLGQSAGRMWERHLEFYENYEEVGVAEQAVHSFLFGERRDVQAMAITVYKDVLNYFEKHPEIDKDWAIQNTRARMLITIAETQDKQTLLDTLAGFDETLTEETIRDAVYYAYLEPDPANYDPSIFTGAREIPTGWARNHLYYRIFSKQGDKRAEIFAEKLRKAGEAHRRQLLQLVIAVTIVIISGLYMMIRYRVFHIVYPWKTSILHNPWSTSDGVHVIIRAATYGILITLALDFLAMKYFNVRYFALWSTLFASLPMLMLIYFYLLKPRGFNLKSAFNLSFVQAGWINFFTVTGSLLALEWVGSLLIGWGTWQLGIGSHWSANMQERMVFGGITIVALSAINIVIWSAIFEEFGFRGLIYTTLRTRLTPTLSIVLSALLFSLVHSYTLAATLTVFWSGLILAYAYERYHSLLPGIFIHAASNMLSLSTVLLFYR